ncbi:TetR/AcrR family transcriptional regulator [Paenibacillus sp. GXUN7292]|uniref:TetR/AcrR family transcriptional regulator n=1 Tax=Paenibacillus sp. GXUN7292 TaxID=3422499 RepID=UPI003D7DB233
MPPKPKFSKEQIINSAFHIAKIEGLDKITIRKVADHLGGSSAPIYVNFNDVGELKRSVIHKIVDLSQQMLREYRSGNPFRDIGIASLKMAIEYPVLIRDFVLKPNDYLKDYKETIKKFKPKYKLIAWVQNIFIPPASYMVDKYFKICTEEQFNHTTGKLFNDKTEIMLPSPNEYPGFIKQMKQIFGTSVYPAYTENSNVSDKLWALCAELTGNPMIAYEKHNLDPKIE